MTLRSVASFLLLPIVLGCGGSTNVGSNGGADGGNGDAGTSSAACPASIPAGGAACPQRQLECEYGNAPGASGCNTYVQCGPSGWGVVPTPSPPAWCGGLPSSCPSTRAGVTEGSACTSDGTRCDYADGTCACSVPEGPVQIDGGGATWHCTHPTTGCPAVAPRAGTPCSQPDLSCDYGQCTLPNGVSFLCAGGAWAAEEGACPL